MKNIMNKLESEVKYRTIIDNSGDAIAIRKKGAFEFANKALSKMLDYSIIELEGIKNNLIFDSAILEEMEKRISKNDLNENISIQFSHGMCPECIKKWYPNYKLEDKK